jgi:CubicO group peptidase (beta-lactamase class C family)
MSYTKRFFAMLSILILSSLLPTTSLPMVASAQDVPPQQFDTASIDAYIQSRMQIDNIPGLALAVTYGEQIVYLQGYGIAAPDGRAVTPQTPFIIGSSSKSFTALAIMQLVEAGRIELDAPVTSYLPWFRTADAAASAQITVRHLLYQNSGLPSYEGRLGIADNDQSNLALENRIRDLSGVQLSQAVGQGYEYANENYNILGLIIQVVTGDSYEDYIRSAIFDPLQMQHSAAALSDSSAQDIATGYRYRLFWPVAFEAPYPRSMTPSGFLISSVEDMSHYLIAQLNGGTYSNQPILSAEGIETLHTAGSRIGSSSSYGMGWVIQEEAGSREIWHNGDVSNFHSNMLLLPEQHIGIVILVNVGGFNNGSALNVPIEGVAAILLGNSITASTNPPLNLIPQLLLLAILLIPILWIVGSFFSIRHWQNHGEFPLRGIHLFWRLFVPLLIDLAPLGLVWIFLPSQFHSPMETIALFAPDAFDLILTLTALSLGWALLRSFLTLRPSPLMEDKRS